MIRLSQLTALEVLDSDIARDLDTSPKLHAYKSTINNRTNTLLVQGDTSLLPQMTRKNAYSPFWNNTLLGTPNFYPEQSLGIANFHNDSDIQSLLNDNTQPTIEYKQAILYFSQGFILDENIVGHAVRLFCKLSNGTEVTLAAVTDFDNDTNITAQKSILFESQLWNEGLKLEFIDVEYLLNSNVSEIQAVRQLLFGNERPTEIHVEYSAFTQESIDEYVENFVLFTRLSLNIINEQSFPITFEQSDMYVNLKLTEDGATILSEPKHTRFDFEPYINTLKEPLEEFDVTHSFTITEFDHLNEQLNINTQELKSPTQKFDEILYRPVIGPNTDHFNITSQIRIENIQTGLVYRMESSIVVTSANVQSFKLSPAITFNITEDIIQNRVTRQVNNIVQSPEVPKIITIEKRLYVQSQELKQLVLIDAEQTVELKIDQDITGNDRMYLKIDNYVIENVKDRLLTFTLPKYVFLTESKKYVLLDGNEAAVGTGKIIKD